ncbi:hypothetical protein ACIGXM_13325 [Kitasatospora sp. NPDC052896]|uniref:hypothetical protein n=1 Tax=Kitasatospora sp. NPDC052896 TaxID=3364061 RepID=UPI0037C5CC18
MARQGWVSRRGLAAAAVAAVAGTGLMAGTASAHTFNITRTCSSVTVDMEIYNAKATNAFSLVIDGQTVVTNQAFGDHFTQTYPVPAHTQAVQATLTVTTSDDPDHQHPGWDGAETVDIPACQTPTPPSSPTPPPPSPSPSPSKSAPAPSPSASTTPPSSPTPSPSAPASVVPTTAAPVPSPSSTSPSLAFTGGGGDAGLIGGVGAAVIVVGGGLVFMSRRRRAAGRH